MCWTSMKDPGPGILVNRNYVVWDGGTCSRDRIAMG